jgi:predicted small metal-binding protein
MSCNFRARANTDDDLWKKISDHAKKVHNIQNMDREMMAKIQGVIKDV